MMKTQNTLEVEGSEKQPDRRDARAQFEQREKPVFKQEDRAPRPAMPRRRPGPRWLDHTFSMQARTLVDDSVNICSKR